MASQSVENYLKIIYKLAQQDSQSRVKTKDIADRLDLALPSVTSMLKALARQGLLDYERYQGVFLTEEGRRAALRVIRKHRLIELFLMRTLDLDWSEVHEEAELLEHALSDKLTDRIEEFLGFPRRDPHGDPIPTRNGDVPEQIGTLLTETRAHAPARIQRVLTQDSELLRYLQDKGLQIGAEVTVTEFAPFGGPIALHVHRRGQPVSLSRQTAELLLVATLDEAPHEDH